MRQALVTFVSALLALAVFSGCIAWALEQPWVRVFAVAFGVGGILRLALRAGRS